MLLEKLKIDRSSIEGYERDFEKGQKAEREIIDRIITGEEKMNVTNNCLLLGWHHKHDN